MGFTFKLCFSEKTRKDSSNTKQVAIFELNKLSEADTLTKEKATFIPAYTNVKRELKRKKLTNQLQTAKARNYVKHCEILEADLHNIDKENFRQGIAESFQCPKKRAVIFKQAKLL